MVKDCSAEKDFLFADMKDFLKRKTLFLPFPRSNPLKDVVSRSKKDSKNRLISRKTLSINSHSERLGDAGAA